MVSLRTLSDLGIDPAFFGITQPANGAAFTYYTFDSESQLPITSHTYWDVVGVHKPSGDPFQIDVRLIHIEEERFDAEHLSAFDAVRDGTGRIGLSQRKLDALIDFLRQWIPSTDAAVVPAAKCLSPLSLDDVVSNGIPLDVAKWLSKDGGTFYRFGVHQQSQDSSIIQLIYLSGWSSSLPHSANMSLRFMRYTTHQLQIPGFNPMDAEGVGTLHFDGNCLIELVKLLEKAQRLL